jgi:hypothetical protein
MGAWGAIIMGFFGAVFAAVTLAWQYHVAGLVLAAPFAAFAAIALAAAYVLRLPGTGVEPSERAGRVIMWSSIGEGVGLFVAANVVQNLHRPELLLPAMALVVGLHFLPIAAAAPFRPFYVLGGALILAAVAGVLVAPPLGGAIAGFAAGTALWVAALLAIRRDHGVKSRPTVA